MYFQPEPILTPQPDGTFTLLVRALVPSSCYTPGSLRPGAPSGTKTIPEVSPYTFEIVHHHGICAQFVHYISASVPGLRSEGKTEIIVFTMVDGHVAGHAMVRFPPAEDIKLASASTPPGWIIADTATATAFSGLIGPTFLNVSALVTTPTPGYKAEFVRAEPQGINPNILLLNLKLTPPDVPTIQIPSSALANYREETYEGNFSDVTLLNGSQHITVPVIAIFSALPPQARIPFTTHV